MILSLAVGAVQRRVGRGSATPQRLFLKGLKPEPRQESRQPEVTAARVTAARVTAAEVGAPDFPGDELGTA